MMIPKRLLVLAGCTAILVACTQDSTTAPPVVAEVGVEAVTGYGSESGTITLTKVRGNDAICLVKITLKGLYNDPNVGDGYWLMQGWVGGTAWSILPEISDDLISARGTYSTQFEYAKSELYLYPISLRYLDMPMGLGWYNVADFSFTPPWAATNFKAVNRCPQALGEP